MILNAESRIWSTPIWVDFMKTDWNLCIRLDLLGTHRALGAYEVELIEGMRLVLFEEDGDFNDGLPDDLMAVGIASYDSDESRWVACDWEPTFHFSELDPESQEIYARFRPEMEFRRRIS
jgi:hypothetical protein